MARHGSAALDRSAFAEFHFPPELITVAVRWYLRYGLSYRDLEELLAERGIQVDHVSVYRWVQRFTPLFLEAARPCRHAPGDRWFVDETYVKVAGHWRYLYRAVDQFGQVIDVRLSDRRDLQAARQFFTSALATAPRPVEVTTDRAAAYPRVLDELLPAARHVVEQYANNRVECDHGRLKARLRPVRGLKRRRSGIVLAAGHASVQNRRRGHYELANTRHRAALHLTAYAPSWAAHGDHAGQAVGTAAPVRSRPPGPVIVAVAGSRRELLIDQLTRCVPWPKLRLLGQLAGVVDGDLNLFPAGGALPGHAGRLVGLAVVDDTVVAAAGDLSGVPGIEPRRSGGRGQEGSGVGGVIFLAVLLTGLIRADRSHQPRPGKPQPRLGVTVQVGPRHGSVEWESEGVAVGRSVGRAPRYRDCRRND